jgi:hypothetical protein
MSAWITPAVTASVGILTIFAQFYNRFVPDVEKQKRHVRIAAMFVLIVLVTAFYVFAIHRAMAKPLTSLIVVKISVSMSILVANLLVFGFLFFPTPWSKSMDECWRLSAYNAYMTSKLGTAMELMAGILDGSNPNCHHEIRGLLNEVDETLRKLDPATER